MKTYVAIAGVALSLAGAATALGASTEGGPVAAMVNGQSITQEALVQRLLAYHGKATLEAMINRALVEQEAKKQGVTASDAEVDTRLSLIKNQLGGAESYNRWLAGSDLTAAQHREQVRATLLTEKIVTKTDPIKDSELEQARVRVILLPTEADAKAVAGTLKNGGDFIQLARERSLDQQTGGQGGLLPPVMQAEFPDIWKAIQGLKPGQTTDPVKLGNAWAIFKLDARRPATQQDERERERNRQGLLSARLNRWLDSARAKAKITYPTPLPG
jgi:parvulin-like peptidyl-prolyl isomerase